MYVCVWLYGASQKPEHIKHDCLWCNRCNGCSRVRFKIGKRCIMIWSLLSVANHSNRSIRFWAAPVVYARHWCPFGFALGLQSTDCSSGILSRLCERSWTVKVRTRTLSLSPSDRTGTCIVSMTELSSICCSTVEDLEMSLHYRMFVSGSNELQESMQMNSWIMVVKHRRGKRSSNCPQTPQVLQKRCSAMGHGCITLYSILRPT